MSIRNILTIFAINCICALLRTLSYIYISRLAEIDAFYAVFIDYFILMNILGLSIVYSYLFFSKGPEEKISLGQMSMVGLLALVISYPFIYLVNYWENNDIPHLVQALFYSIVSLLTTGWIVIVVLYVQNREVQPKFHQLKQQYIEQSNFREKTEMELQLLQAQIEPHFFFNTLACLHNLIDFDQIKAKTLLEELTEYLRTTIPAFRQKFVKLSEEREMIRRYLAIQEIRFSGKFTFEISISQELNKLPVLPMSLLTLVENAIKHGIEKNNGKGKITICCEQTASNTLVMMVKDSVGLYSSDSSGTGLSNLASRIRLTYSDQANFSIKLSNNSETVAKLEVPIDG